MLCLAADTSLLLEITLTYCQVYPKTDFKGTLLKYNNFHWRNRMTNVHFVQALTCYMLIMTSSQEIIVPFVVWCRIRVALENCYLNLMYRPNLSAHSGKIWKWNMEGMKWENKIDHNGKLECGQVARCVYPLIFESITYQLTHWGRDKMVDIFQTTFSNGFSWMNLHELRLKFHWSLFLAVQLTIYQHWFR